MIGQAAKRLLDRGIGWAGLAGDALAYVLGDVCADGRWLVVCDADDRMEPLVEAVRFFHPSPERVLALPADDVKPYDGFSPDPSVVRERLRTLARVDGGGPVVVVTTARALLQRLPDRATRRKGTRVLQTGDIVDRDDLARWLQAAGYLATGRVDGPGTFAVRGDLVDVWGAGLAMPVRIDLWDDEVERLHRFDPATHKAVKAIDRVALLPAKEERVDAEALERARAELGRLVAEQQRGLQLRRRVTEELAAGIRFSGIDAWLPALVPTVAPLEALADLRPIVVYPEDVAAAAREAERQAQERWRALDDDERPLVPPEERYVSAASLLDALAGAHEVLEFVKEGRAEDLNTRAPDGFAVKGAELAPVAARIRELAQRDLAVALVADSAVRAERLGEMLANHGVATRHATVDGLERGRVHLVVGPLRRGFVAEDAGLAFITASTLFGGGRRAARRRERIHQFFDQGLTTVAQLRDGDHVVHRLHGIGLYHGLVRLDLGGVEQDFVALEYRGGDRLYLPVTALDQLSRYAPSRRGAKVQLDRLGGDTWARRQQKVRDSVLAAANELLRIYARRELAERPAYPPPGPMYRAFEARFPYDETPDQAAAIEAVNADLASDAPMDRLICGDVGFGKTEVAMRAAMRVVEAGKQVAVLCPTTVLAYQHYNRFRERFEGLPVRVALLSRFGTPAEERAVKKALRSGEVDVVIGTRRLLGRTVRFADLGLLVIDEEHRFGVKQKDQLKKMRASVDVLAMSATPIPRTLEMALSGLREMSLIATPPEDRLAVATSVARMSRTRVRDAIQQELDRGGQVFFLHNRVQTIDRVAERLAGWVPSARIAVAHGQMDAELLEKVLVEFIDKKHDVLVCSAIVESGVDLPNVNTMIVDRADQFGLAQLHQLRGRVGRGSVRGHCLLLTPEQMTKEARHRLRVLVENSSLGAGFRIASEDLELRGGGNLLGESQSGNIDAVGYDMWVELLADAVHEARGDLERARIEPDINVPVPAFIPEDYVSDMGERLSWYRRLSAADDEASVDKLLDELEGWFGEPPPEVVNVAGLARVRALCRELGVQRVAWMKVRVLFELHPASPVPASRLDAMVAAFPKRMSLRREPGDPARLTVRFLPQEGSRPIQFLRWVLAQLSRDPS